MHHHPKDSTLIGWASIPDGYFGARVNVGLWYLDGRVYVAHPHGYHRAAFVPLCASFAEAQWTLRNHPDCKRICMNLTLADEECLIS